MNHEESECPCCGGPMEEPRRSSDEILARLESALLRVELVLSHVQPILAKCSGGPKLVDTTDDRR